SRPSANARWSELRAYRAHVGRHPWLCQTASCCSSTEQARRVPPNSLGQVGMPREAEPLLRCTCPVERKSFPAKCAALPGAGRSLQLCWLLSLLRPTFSDETDSRLALRRLARIADIRRLLSGTIGQRLGGRCRSSSCPRRSACALVWVLLTRRHSPLGLEGLGATFAPNAKPRQPIALHPPGDRCSPDSTYSPEPVLRGSSCRR